MITLIKNIKELVQVEENPKVKVCGEDMGQIQTILDAFLLIEDDRIKDFGKMSLLDNNIKIDLEVDAKNSMVFPSFCDSHTHLVYSGSREIEYIDKIKGLSYEEIAKRGGGILNSAKKIQEASEESLYEDAQKRLDEIIKMGTGAVEIKSGYGLNTQSELKMLRVIKRLKENSPLTIKANFLGAHALPLEYRDKPDAFVDIVVNEMIPMVAKESLAEFIDVFCDKGFFTTKQTDRILKQGIKYGLRPKIHANEMDLSGGVQIAVENDALSCDHLEFIGKDEIECLLSSNTMPTILPGAAFFLNMRLSPAREMIASGLPIAMASDFNPGSSPSGNMQMIVSFACINYKMTPQEAFNATTINSAYAMNLSKTHGSIAKGKIANFYITKPIPNMEYMPYYYGTNKVDRVFLNGKEYSM
ncbi:MAG: imidazolonepropionase [Bacteroidales bacterium]|jgi:imidazolonepropionase|nr:imidazolonepropionase [Bacteroidales bacterium]